MNIGDRVRLLRGKEEGIVVGIRNNVIEIEIEDGFVIPAMRSEVVIVSREEAIRFQTEGGRVEQEQKKTQVFAESGLYLAFVSTSNTTYELYIINNTDYTIAFNLFQDHKNKFKGIYSAIFKPKTSEFTSNISILETEVSDYVIQALYFLDFITAIKEPLLKRIKPKSFLISGELKKAPIINKESILIQIDAELQAINVKKLKETLVEGPDKPLPVQTFKSPGKEIDLHIEKLETDWQKMSNSQILEIQINTFETSLDRAIASGQDEIKFIHGIGNGVLKNEIQKRLSKMKNIRYYEDAMRNHFGVGATLVKIK